MKGKNSSMTAGHGNPAIYEINTGVWLNELSQKYGENVTLGNIPEEEVNTIVRYGFSAIWLMGVWKRSAAGLKLARNQLSVLKTDNASPPKGRVIKLDSKDFYLLSFKL